MVSSSSAVFGTAENHVTGENRIRGGFLSITAGPTKMLPLINKYYLNESIFNGDKIMHKCL